MVDGPTTRAGAPMLVLSLLVACSPNDGVLIVRLQTDYLPGTEFDGATVELLDAEEDVLDARPVTVASTVDALAGTRLAEFDGVASGQHAVRVHLHQAGRRRASGRVELDVSGSQIVTVVVHRRCEGVFCPGPSDAPDATACFAGACVPPACRPEAPDTCGEPCTTDEACPGEGCGRGSCREGICFVVPDDAACGVNQACDLADGCFDLPVDAGPPDAGPPDAGPPDAGPPDAGPPDTGPPPPPLPDCPPRARDCGSGQIESWDRTGSWGCRPDGALSRTGGTLTCRVCNAAGCVDCTYSGVVVECRCREDECSSGICADVVNSSSRCDDDGTPFGCRNIVDRECPNG